MKNSGRWLVRQIAGCLVLLLIVPFEAAANSRDQETSPDGQAGAVTSTQAQGQNSTSGVNNVNSGVSRPESLPNSPGVVRSENVGNNWQPSGQQPSAKQEALQEPVGTAAAKSVETTGVAGSNPAGAAIAPAKQRRTRAFFIKVGAIVGAGVAVGTVMALSSASPSRPPGAR